MSGVALIVASGAACIAIASGIFGVGMARLRWADDLRHAQHIDEIRSQTESHLRAIIGSQQRSIDSLNETIAIQKRRLGDAP